MNEGSSATYEVKLSSVPTSEVTVTVTLLDDSDLVLSHVVSVSVSVTVSGSVSGSLFSLTFTTDDWNTYQTVTVYAGDDDDIHDDVNKLRHSASGGGYSVSSDVTMTVTDNDSGELDIFQDSQAVGEPIRITEGSSGDSSFYAVRLAAEPSGTVTVLASVLEDSDLVLIAGAVTVSASFSGSLFSLTFTTADWNTYQTVSVSATSDFDAEDESVTLRHTASGGGYDDVSSDEVVVYIGDLDKGKVRLRPSSLSMREGSSDQYEVGLSSHPHGEVTVTVTLSEDSDLVLTHAVSNVVFGVGVGVSVLVDVHVGELEHLPDGDGARAGRRRHRKRGGDAAPRSVGRRQRHRLRSDEFAG